jgi:hypothetical protein
LIDINGDYFFIANEEVLSLVDESKLVNYDSIKIKNAS